MFPPEKFVHPIGRDLSRTKKDLNAFQASWSGRGEDDMLMPMRNVDENILTLVARSDREAFAELYDGFAPRLLGMIVHMGLDRRDAEDVLQDVFREIWCRADRYDPRLGSPESWLLRLARSRAIDHLRRSGSESARVRRAEALAVSPAEPATRGADDRDELAERAQDGLKLLSDEQRDAVNLAFRCGLTARQIGELRGIPTGTVKTRIRLAMAKLRAHLQPHLEGMQT